MGFESRVDVFSNIANYHSYDVESEKARKLAKKIILIIRFSERKDYTEFKYGKNAESLSVLANEKRTFLL
jgi:hypothetical protein